MIASRPGIPRGAPTHQDLQALAQQFIAQAQLALGLSDDALDIAGLLRRSGVGGPIRASVSDLLAYSEACIAASERVRRLAWEQPLGAPPLPVQPRRAGSVVIEIRDEIRHRLELEIYTRAMLAEDLEAIGCKWSAERIGAIERDDDPIPAHALLGLRLVILTVRAAGARPSRPQASEFGARSRAVYTLFRSPADDERPNEGAGSHPEPPGGD